MRIALVVIVIIGLVAGGAAYYTKYIAAEPPTTYRTAPVKRDNIISIIKATGTVEPEEVVDVGAQVVGRIKELGLDPNDPEHKKHIDYGSFVHEGTVLAIIDEAVYKAQLDQAQAANVRAQADLQQFQARLLQTVQDRKRAEELRTIKDIPGTTRPIKGIADSEYDLAVANNEMAKANVAVAEATIKQTEAQLKLAKTNLDYTIIKSPVEGVIIARRVNIGQTVAGGSLNTPSMFLIAKDLAKMQVWASVNEADIGLIRSREEMPVSFTVDAYPGELFHGKVVQIRYNAQMTQNVVLYTVVVAFDNSDLKLIPYLTANLQFEVEEREKVLLAPNTALRWKPRLEQVLPELREKLAPSIAERVVDRENPGAARSPGGASAEEAGKGREEDRGRLWVEDNGYVRPIEVQTGVSDETVTEVAGKEVKEGMKVVTGEMRGDSVADSDTTNPFAPRLFRGRRGR